NAYVGDSSPEFHPMSTGTANVGGPNSQWINTGGLRVGRSAPGTLNITAGGRVQDTFGEVGESVGISGTVTVAGLNSQVINADELDMGASSNGTLNVADGGGVQSKNGYVGRFIGSAGDVTVSGAGSTWTMTGRLAIGGDIDTGTKGGPGTLHIQSGGTVSV